MSSSGTRLTNEFRYVLYMIILVVWAGGWFRAAAIRAAPRSPTTTGKVERWHKTMRVAELAE